MGNTVLSTYIVDNYPDYANEVITFYSVIINVSRKSSTTSKGKNTNDSYSFLHSSTPGSFTIGLKLQVCNKTPLRSHTDSLLTGYAWTFAAQCIICAFGLIPIYLLLQKFGPGLRLSRPMYLKHVEDVEIEGVAQDELNAVVSGHAVDDKPLTG